MPKIVTFSADIYPYCLGDTVTLSDEELKTIDATAKARKLKAYEVANVTVASPAEDDEEKTAREAKEADEKKAAEEAEAKRKAEEEAAAKKAAEEEEAKKSKSTKK